jgi:CubicO group peptidase (beta-lactamase class C family)
MNRKHRLIELFSAVAAVLALAGCRQYDGVLASGGAESDASAVAAGGDAGADTPAGAQAESARPADELAAYRDAAAYSASVDGKGVLVMKRGDVVFEEYHNGHSAEKPWRLASGTKSFSGAMAAAAVADGLLSLDERVSDTITEWQSDERKREITIRQLLSLSSGLDAGRIGRAPSYAESVKLARARWDAGTHFDYGPLPFQIFGEVMKRKLVSRGETVMGYLKRRVLDPIGLSVAYWRGAASGEPVLPHGANLTAREWVKFGELVRLGGSWNGRQVLPAAVLEECFAGTAANPAYGITFWLLMPGVDGKGPVPFMRNEIEPDAVPPELPQGVVMAAGAGDQRLYVIRDLDMVVVRQGDSRRFTDKEFLRRLLVAELDE